MYARQFLPAAVLICALPGIALAQTVVHPTGDPAIDVPAVRDAVSQGSDTVLLKATDVDGQPQAFDFGDVSVGAIDWNVGGSGYVALGLEGSIHAVDLGFATLWVSLGDDLHLRGETVDGAATTVRGGTVPIRNFDVRDVPGVGVKTVYGLANLSIEGIRFTESALQSIYTLQLGNFDPVIDLLEANGPLPRIEITDNAFVDVQPAYSSSVGIWYALGAVTDRPAGAVILEENRVSFTSGRWDAEERAYEQDQGLPPGFELWEGLSIAYLGAPGHVLRNHVEGVDVGLLVYFPGEENVRIAHNHVALRPEGFVGIAGGANHIYTIERNTVIAPGTFPEGISLFPWDPDIGFEDAVVRHNHVVMDSSAFGAITLVGRGTNNLVAQNRVEGGAAYALGLVDDVFAPGSPATRNDLQGNDLSAFTPLDSFVYGAGSHVLLDVHTERNVVLGSVRSVRDHGVDNFVTGARVPGPPPGPVISEILGERRMLLLVDPE